MCFSNNGDGTVMELEPPPVVGGSTFERCCYNLHMPKKDDDDKDRKTERGEHEEKSKEQQSTSAEDREKRKLPEPTGNLRRRADWFKKRH